MTDLLHSLMNATDHLMEEGASDELVGGLATGDLRHRWISNVLDHTTRPVEPSIRKQDLRHTEDYLPPRPATRTDGTPYWQVANQLIVLAMLSRRQMRRWKLGEVQVLPLFGP